MPRRPRLAIRARTTQTTRLPDARFGSTASSDHFTRAAVCLLRLRTTNPSSSSHQRLLPTPAQLPGACQLLDTSLPGVCVFRVVYLHRSFDTIREIVSCYPRTLLSLVSSPVRPRVTFLPVLALPPVLLLPLRLRQWLLNRVQDKLRLGMSSLARRR